VEVKGVVLVRPKNPTNVGSIARVMAAFGVNELIIVSDEENFIRLISAKSAKKAASGGVYVLENAKRYNSLKELEGRKIGTISIFDNKRYGFKLIPVKEISKLEGEYYLVFGGESAGLTKEELELCEYISTIPTNDKFGILNLAVAVTLYLYEIYKYRFLDLLKNF